VFDNYKSLLDIVDVGCPVVLLTVFMTALFTGCLQLLEILEISWNLKTLLEISWNLLDLLEIFV